MLRPRHPSRVPDATGPSDASVRDAGLSLVEIVLAVVLSTLIGGVLVAALGTSMTAADRTSATIANSVDEQLITAFLARDAQAAGGVDPLTTQILGTLGVSTDDDAAGWAGCVQPADLAVRFASVDLGALTSSQVVVTYALHPDGRFVQRACEGGTATESVLASAVTAVDVTCEPIGCAGIPDSVVVVVRGGPPTSPFEVTVRASLRPEPQTPPDITNATQVPLLVTGSSACPVLSSSATGGVHVLGSLVVADDCGLPPVGGDLASWAVSGTTALIGGVADPLADITPPASCAATPSVAAPSVTVHTSPVTITTAVDFQPGRHVFCGGLTIEAGASVSGTDVLVYVPHGGLTVASGATVSLSPATTGPYAGISVWSAGTDDVAISSGASVHDLRGTVYVPDARVQLTSISGISVGALVADRVTLAGTGPIRFGQQSPTLTVATTPLPDATNLQPYSASAPVVSGGTAPLRYQATDLPAGLVISSTGTISGTPTSSGTATVSFVVVDATGASAAFTRTITVSDPVPV